MNKPFESIDITPEESEQLFKDYYSNVIFVDYEDDGVIPADPQDTDEDGDPDEMLIALKQLVFGLTEVKANVIRRVRTPDGARKFGQPIGSIIVPNVVPNMPRDILPNMSMSDWTDVEKRIPELRKKYPLKEGYVVTGDKAEIRIQHKPTRTNLVLTSDWVGKSGLFATLVENDVPGEGKPRKRTTKLDDFDKALEAGLKNFDKNIEEAKSNGYYAREWADAVRSYQERGIPIYAEFYDDKYSTYLEEVPVYIPPIEKEPEVEQRNLIEIPVPKKKKKLKKNFDIPKFEIQKGVGNSGSEYIYTIDKKNNVAIVSGHGRYYYSALSKEGTLQIDESTGLPIKSRTINLSYVFPKTEKMRPVIVNHLATKPYIEALYEEYDGASPSHVQLWDVSEGIYGMDWVYDDEVELEPEDIEGRIEAQEREKKELGIFVRKSSDNSAYEVDVDAEDIILMNARNMENIIPNFNKVQPLYVLDPKEKNAVAYHGLHGYTNMRKDKNFSVDNPVHTPYNVIGLSTEYWSIDFSEEKLEALRRRYELQSSKWWSVNFVAEAKERDMQPWEVFYMKTLTHESGHTIGDIIFGGVDIRTHTSQGIAKDVPIKFKYRDKYLPEFHKILAKYGLASPDAGVAKKPNGSVDYDGMVFADKEYMKFLLSEYGGESLHELLAEAWADYLLSSSPKPFSVEIGELMMEVALDYTENEVKD